jgi:hypothetical protein
MDEGYLIDRGHGNQRSQAEWVEGPPEIQRWLGLNVGIRIKDRRVLKVSVYRCPRCGLLESYA